MIITMVALVKHLVEDVSERNDMTPAEAADWFRATLELEYPVTQKSTKLLEQRADDLRELLSWSRAEAGDALEADDGSAAVAFRSVADKLAAILDGGD